MSAMILQSLLELLSGSDIAPILIGGILIGA